MTRGEIWWVDFGVPFGSEVGFRRPVIILQNNILNESNLRTVVCVTQPHLIVHIDKSRLIEKVSKLSSPIIDTILEGVIATLIYHKMTDTMQGDKQRLYFL